MMRRNTIAFLLVMLACMTGVLWVAPHLFSSVQAQDVQRLVLRDSSGENPVDYISNAVLVSDNGGNTDEGNFSAGPHRTAASLPFVTGIPSL